MTLRFLSSACLAVLLTCSSVAAADGGDALTAQPIDAKWVARWREDLTFAKVEMGQSHIRVDHTTPRPQLDAMIDDLANRLPHLAHHQAVVELTRIVALIGDGHTRLTLPIDPASGFVGGHRQTEETTLPGTPFRHYPVRFFLYQDGLAVERIERKNAALLGARVLRIGSLGVGEAMAAVEPTVHRDNEMQVWEKLPTHLVIPEILHAQGVVEALGPVSLELESATGERIELTLDPVPLGHEVDWAERPAASIPTFRRHLDQNYRFEHFEDQKTVYFRYVAVQNEDEGESLPDFSTRMFDFIDSHDVERLIVDIRGNGGGDNWLNAPLERGIIRAESLWRPGGLVVLADRYTFSAAMNFASFLAGDTPAVFVGEPTGGRPNHYGDARQMQLPNTGLTVRLSTVYHQDAGAEDDREQIDPHLPTQLSTADILAGRDPALDEVLRWDRPGDPEGSWQGPATMRQYTTTVRLDLEQAAEGWSGTFSAPGWFEVTAIANVQHVDGEIRFDIPLESTTIRVRAWATDERLIGMFGYQGQWYPFVTGRT